MVMDIMWPDEKPTWTAGAILLAADALTDYTRASKLFNSVELLEPSQQAQGMSSAKVLKKS